MGTLGNCFVAEPALSKRGGSGELLSEESYKRGIYEKNRIVSFV